MIILRGLKNFSKKISKSLVRVNKKVVDLQPLKTVIIADSKTLI